MALLAGIVIKITNKDGTVTKVPVRDGAKIEITTEDDVPQTPVKQPATLPGVAPTSPAVPEDEEVADVIRPELPPWQLPEGAPVPAIAPFAADEARQHQEHWATYLKRPVVETNDLGMKFALIPPGEFVLPVASESPATPELDLALRRKVRLTTPYLLGTTEITRDQFQRFVEATGHRTRLEPAVAPSPEAAVPISWRNPGPYKPAPEEPVTYVSLDDAQAFCRWLGKQDGRGYRLPTEAEWEFACLAGGLSVPGGALSRRDLPKLGWLNFREASTSNPQSPVHPVGQKQANPFRLFDMVGNVCEWCADGDDGSNLSQLMAINPRSPAGPSVHGSVLCDERNWETGSRFLRSKDTVYSAFGFRVVQMLTTEPEIEADRPLAEAAPADPAVPRLPPWKLPEDAPPPAVAPFSAAKARQHQQRWADYLHQDLFTTNSLGIRLALIPPGECDFALTKDGQERPDPDTPHLPVRITQPLYLATTEVSVAQFRQFVEATSYQTDAEREGQAYGTAQPELGLARWGQNASYTWKTPGSWVPQDNEPVVVVSHVDAVAFCEWLSQTEKVRYRLAYDAE